jgi:two-component system, OmpR family, KDP operon response regulator KdpE
VRHRTDRINARLYLDRVLHHSQSRSFVHSMPEDGAGKRIVVVDDHQDTCAFLSTALKGAGYEVETAEEGGQALALMASRPPDLLITDLFMPGLEGFETITRCRAEFPQTTIMVISAGTIPGMRHDLLATARLLGISATLRKPFHADTLLATVQQALQPQQNEFSPD